VSGQFILCVRTVLQEKKTNVLSFLMLGVTEEYPFPDWAIELEAFSRSMR